MVYRVIAAVMTASSGTDNFILNYLVHCTINIHVGVVQLASSRNCQISPAFFMNPREL